MVNARTSALGSGDVDVGEEIRGGLPVGADQRSHLLDEEEQVVAGVPAQGVTEERAQQTDIRPEGLVAVVFLTDRPLHRCSLGAPGPAPVGPGDDLEPVAVGAQPTASAFRSAGLWTFEAGEHRLDGTDRLVVEGGVAHAALHHDHPRHPLEG